MALDLVSMQRLARPVDSFYEGRALRMREDLAAQDMRLAKQQERINELEIKALENPPAEPADANNFYKALGTEAQAVTQYRDSLPEGLSDEEISVQMQPFWQNSRARLNQISPDFDFVGDSQWTPETDRELRAYLTQSGSGAGWGNLYNRITGETISRRRDSPEWDEYTRMTDSDGHIWTEVGKAQPQGSRSDLDMLTPSQRGDRELDIEERNRAATANIGEISLAMAAFAGVEDPAGFKGWLGENLGGIAGQLHPGFGDFVSGLFTGADMDDLAVVRTRAKALVARLLPSITGEESGRFTDTERRNAEEIEGAIDLATSKEQVMTNMSELMAIEFRGLFRDAKIYRREPPYDMSNREDVNALAMILRRSGMPDDLIEDNIVIFGQIQDNEIY